MQVCTALLVRAAAGDLRQPLWGDEDRDEHVTRLVGILLFEDAT
jgi:hypothetical protein